MIAKELITYEQVSVKLKETNKQKNLKALLVMNEKDEKAMLKSGTGKYENKKGYAYINAMIRASKQRF